MRRLVPGSRIHLADGRWMIVQRIETVDGVRVVYWSPVVAIKAAA